MNVSRVYADALKSMPSDYCDSERLEIDWDSPDRYTLISSVGRGKFSEVFKAFDTITNEYVSIKHLKPVRRRKIRREIKIMQNLKDGPFILPILNMVKDPETDAPNIVTKWVDTIDYKEFYASLSDYEFRYYIYKMLVGLDFAHSRGIMHRDIKPQNILIDYKTHDVFIIDWGLAEFYDPEKKFNVRVSTRNYKGPELLTNNEHYDYSVDLWSFGCMLAGLIFNRVPFFRARDNTEQLRRIVDVLGTDGLVAYIRKFGLDVKSDVISKFGTCRKRDWSEFAAGGRKELLCTELYDLLDNLLVYDHSTRYTAKECMSHPYFDKVRDEVEAELGKKSVKECESAYMELLGQLEDLERGMKDRVKYEVSEGGYEMVMAICENLKILDFHIANLKNSPTNEMIEEAKLFVETYETINV